LNKESARSAPEKSIVMSGTTQRYQPRLINTFYIEEIARKNKNGVILKLFKPS